MLRTEPNAANAAAGQASEVARIWLPELVERFASYLPHNAVTCSLRVVDKATAAQFRSRPEYALVVQLSQPVPPHAFEAHWRAPGATKPLSLQQRHRLLCLTAASGSIPNLKVALACVDLVPTAALRLQLVEAAAAAGALDMCRWLILRGYPASISAMTTAARAGQQAVCELLLASGVTWSMQFVCAAARGGHPDLMAWLLLRRPAGPLVLRPAEDGGGFFPRVSSRTLVALVESVAEGCELAVLQQLLRLCFGTDQLNDQQPDAHWRRCSGNLLRLGAAAAARSTTADWQAKVELLESLEPVPPEGYERSAVACASAAACGPHALDRLKWLMARGHPVDGRVAEAAARHGNTAALRWLLAVAGTVLPAPTSVVADAAQAGELGVLQLLHAHRACPIDPVLVAREAARAGKLEVLSWAVDVLGAPVQERSGVPGAAAASGSIEVMAWLHQRGCEWGPAAFMEAAVSGCTEALEWLAAHSCPMPVYNEAYCAAAQNHDMATLRCLRSLGCPWSQCNNVLEGCMLRPPCKPLQVLRALVDTGCPIRWGYVLCGVWHNRGRGGYTHIPMEVRVWLAGLLVEFRASAGNK